MTKVALIYYSGYGHTKKQAEAVEEGVTSVQDVSLTTINIPDDGTISDDDWETLGEADAIIYGSATYMGGPAWQFKKFADESSKRWFDMEWKDKIAGGFTNSGAVNGDKFNTILYFFTLSQQHGQVWIGTGLLPANKKEHGPEDVNWTGGFSGAFSISPVDADPDEAPRSGDLETARLYGERIATFAAKLS
ncbi:flavodoxin family protein [uncultured Sneathiella sp.]|jgi:multimeric flavodoxin WrbA|uniref:flavodoxin family protein n=1 Tax=uncultured Sneathiella sp. TaxID=879315 RepID=UPI0030D71F87|tara:strand:+ start:1346 stop:1918 length:573 start_codon:yes stop_codon:yes gene_type:complete